MSKHCYYCQRELDYLPMYAREENDLLFCSLYCKMEKYGERIEDYTIYRELDELTEFNRRNLP